MKFILALLALVLVAPLAACRSDCGGVSVPPPPSTTLHWPITFDPEPVTIPGERLRQRTYTVTEAPSWQALQPAPQGLGACPPQNVVPFTAGAAAPCR